MVCRAASEAVRSVGRGENTTDPRRRCDNAPPENPDGASWRPRGGGPQSACVDFAEHRAALLAQ
ncbi:hypothetical protein DF141_27330 [Burkholderia cenocepacia]|nr:hypothetical protein DF141_27330 [Burkholderia cenocepacia]RQZ88741.1 hypothetical protein DF058_27495 [Burkholderia cenocepacia]RRA08971.1 hypothetical protein DF059_27550 [Burkholderia cenocepacia]